MKFCSEDFVLVIEDKPEKLSLEQIKRLSLTEQNAVSALKNEKRKIEYVISRLLLREILKHEYSEIYYEQTGKPCMKGFQISISHSNSQVSVIASRNCMVAVDVEEYRQQILSVKDKFASPREQMEFASLEDLILLWSAKETLFKQTNASADLLNYNVVKESSSELTGRVMIENVLNIIKLYYFRNDKFCLVWACEKI